MKVKRPSKAATAAQSALTTGALAWVLTALDIPVIILDLDRRVRSFAPKAESVFNLSGTAIGRPLDLLALGLDPLALEQQLATAVATTVKTESEVQDRSGRWYRLQIDSWPETASDRLGGVMLSFWDIDSLKRLREQAAAAQDEAERANRAEDEFLALLSHDLRSPVTSILMHTQLLRRGGMEHAALARAVDAIENGAKAQVRLIDELLDVSRLAAGKLRIQVRIVDLCAVANTVILGVSPQIAGKSLTCAVDLRAQPTLVSADERRLSQIVATLLSNAIKFSTAGGIITIAVQVIGARAWLSVRDTGVGITAEFLARVFERFAQEQAASPRRYGRLTMGLATLRHLVELHGGTVRAESAGRGHGSTFSVSLPLHLG